jgi:hypothetical protein
MAGQVLAEVLMTTGQEEETDMQLFNRNQRIVWW